MRSSHAEFGQIRRRRQQGEKLLARAARPDHEGDAEQENQFCDGYELRDAQSLGAEEGQRRLRR
jgi:hypothetical protein